MFRHANVKPKEKSGRTGAKNCKNLASNPGNSNPSPDWTEKRIRKESLFLLSRIGHTLPPSEEDLTLCFFYQTTLESLIHADRAQYLHLQLPTLFSRSEAGSALRLATQAISLAIWARSRPDDLKASQLSRKRYSQALSAMNAAIQDPVEVKSDDTLYAVLLLSGYEVRLIVQLESWLCLQVECQ